MQHCVILTLVVFLTALHSGESQGEEIFPQCSQVTISDLGREDVVASEGLVSQAFGFPVRINRFNILCLSSSNFMDRHQSASVLVGYFCPSCPGNGTVEEIVEQLTFDCTSTGPFSWNSTTVQRAIPTSVNFDTPLERSCALCEHPERLDAGVQPASYNQNTHCIRKWATMYSMRPPNNGHAWVPKLSILSTFSEVFHCIYCFCKILVGFD